MKKRVLETPDLCTGCSACISACAKDAISLREDPEQQYGYTAWIDSEKCVDCGKCRQVCPVCSPAAPEQKEEVKKALAAGVPKAMILTYFYPEVTVEKMSSYRKTQ